MLVSLLFDLSLSLSLSVGGVNSGLSNVKRPVPSTADVNTKQDGGVVVRKAPSQSPPSPLLGNANNPNKADIPDRKTGNSLTPNVRACFKYIFFTSFFSKNIFTILVILYYVM